MTNSRSGPIGIGIVGAGFVGQLAHLESFVSVENCRVVGLAELRPELGRRVAEKYGIPNVYDDHHGLLKDPAVDAVVVVTRRAATGPIVLDALNAGKHVLSEKPMAHTVEQGERLVHAAARSGKRYAVGFMKRHDPGVQQAKSILDRLHEGRALGSVVGARGYCFGGDAGRPADGYIVTSEPRPEGLVLWPVAPNWMPEDMVDRYAEFLNVFTHVLNMLRYLLGKMPRVTSARLPSADEDEYVARLDFGGIEAILELAVSETEGWHEGVEIEFEKGSLDVRFPPPLKPGATAEVFVDGALGADFTTSMPSDPRWAFQCQAEAFITDIIENRTPLADGADAIDDLRLAEAVWRSSLAGETTEEIR